MRFRFGAIVIAALGPLCAGARADDNIPAANDLLPAWSQDVPGGKVQHKLLPVTCSRQISLIVRMDNTNLDQQGPWASVITMQLRADKIDAAYDYLSESVVLQLIGRRDGSASPFSFYRAENGTTGEHLPVGSAAFHEDIPISLSWNEKNEVMAKVGGGEPAMIAMNHAPASLDLSVSGAIATFHDIKMELAPGRQQSACAARPAPDKPPQ